MNLDDTGIEYEVIPTYELGYHLGPEPKPKEVEDPVEKLPDVSQYDDSSIIQQKAASIRRDLVFELKVQGHKYKNIAKILKKRYREDDNLNEDNLPDGYDENYVGDDVDKKVNEYVTGQLSNVKKYVVIELHRIESMIRSLWERATDLDGKTAELKAVDRIIRLQERKAKLLGLDAPEKVDILTQTQDDGEYQGFKWADTDELELDEEDINSRVKQIGQDEDQDE